MPAEKFQFLRKGRFFNPFFQFLRLISKEKQIFYFKFVISTEFQIDVLIQNWYSKKHFSIKMKPKKRIFVTLV